MINYYGDQLNKIEIHHQIIRHVAPHLHNELECVYVTDGEMELGIGEEWFHMEKGDFALVFPTLLHHYQVFSEENTKAFIFSVAQNLLGPFQETILQQIPVSPVIHARHLHSDVLFAIRSLYQSFVRINYTRNLMKHAPEDRSQRYPESLHQAYVQLILSRTLGFLDLAKRKNTVPAYLTYAFVSYITAHFTEDITLESVSHEIGCSPFALSRLISGTIHSNFNQYLNERRLEYAAALLRNTTTSITEIYELAGFQSQRTFNRVFREHYKLSPKEYRREALTHQQTD